MKISTKEVSRVALVKIIADNYEPAEGGKLGDIVEITDPAKLIEEGKVELYVKKVEKIDKVVSDNTDSKVKKSRSSKKKSK